MIHVIIDTSVLQRDPKRQGKYFRLVCNLARLRKIQVHIPWIVKEEFITKRVQQIKECFKYIRSKIDEIGRNAVVFNGRFPEILDPLQGMDEECEEKIREEFDHWLSICEVQVHSLCGEHGKRVFDRYFKGDGVFTQLKCRKDIPDAFVWESVEDIASSLDEVCLIASDAGFKKTVKNQSKVILFESLENFLETKFSHADLVSIWAEINIESFISNLSDNSSEFLEKIDWNDIQSIEFEDEKIPEDNHTATLEFINDPSFKNIEVCYEDAEPIGEHEISIPFSLMEVLSDVSYLIYSRDFILEDAERVGRAISLAGDWNDHYDMAEEEIKLDISGNLIVCFPSDPGHAGEISLKDLMEGLEISIEDIEVSVSESVPPI